MVYGGKSDSEFKCSSQLLVSNFAEQPVSCFVSKFPWPVEFFMSGFWLIQTTDRTSSDGPTGLVNRDNVWLHNYDGNCWINESEVQLTTDVIGELSYCPGPIHRFAVVKRGYSRQDCFEGPSLSAPSTNLGTGQYVDVSCSIYGEAVQNNQ